MSFRDQILAADTDAERAAVIGVIGDFTSASVPIGSAVALTTNTDATVASIQLPAGDWDVQGNVGFSPAANTSMTHVSSGVSTVAATMNGIDTQAAISFPAIVPGATTEWLLPTPTVRLLLSVPTTVYLVSHALFTVSTLGAYGTIRARRMG
mgnify:CR=1 FL=1